MAHSLDIPLIGLKIEKKEVLPEIWDLNRFSFALVPKLLLFFGRSRERKENTQDGLEGDGLEG